MLRPAFLGERFSITHERRSGMLKDVYLMSRETCRRRACASDIFGFFCDKCQPEIN
jgi:hypothetical protein